MILIALIEMFFDMLERVKERQAISELYAMSDRDLRDIGITRYDIDYNVKHGNDRR